MNVLEVYYRDELISEHHLSGKEVKIGREKWNDVILTDPAVSRGHAVITVESDRPVIIDKSSHGTFVNGQKISRSELRTDDKITIGPYSLYIREYSDDRESREVQTTIHEKTLSIPVHHGKNDISFLLHQASLHFIKGAAQGSIFQIKRERVTFGKSPDNDLVMEDDFISRHHGEISFRRGQFFIRDLGSRNGTFVNGKRIHGLVLEPGAMIEAGKTVLEFVLSAEGAPGETSKENTLCEMVGGSPAMQKLYGICKRAASCDATVLLSGETGTGKELAAKTIHALSSRARGPFITIDCGSIPRELMESELFGHEKGAFTGAQNRKKGAFELGHQGTVFLDEVGELPKELQPKLLRILEEREFKRVGGETYIRTDIRVIAATNRELNREVMKGTFREDLFFRLYVVPITLPPLRERSDDIPMLVDYFIQRNPLIAGENVVTFTLEALKKMEGYSWPGNVRELKNTVERAIVGAGGQKINADDIRFIPSIKENAPSLPSAQTSLEEIEKQAIIDALKAQGGNKKATAKVLGIAYSTMCEKVKKYGIEI